jgi:hypothetical protein
MPFQFNGDYLAWCLHGLNRWQLATTGNPDGTVRIPMYSWGYRLGLTIEPNRETIGMTVKAFVT